MRKDDLLRLGLGEELAEKAAQAFAEELKGFIPKGRFDEVNTARNHAEAAVRERDAKIEELRAAAEAAEALKRQVGELEELGQKKDADHAEELRRLRVEAAVQNALTAARARNLKAARALLNLEGAELEEDGSVKGLAEQIRALSEGEETGFLFERRPRMRGAWSGEEGLEEGDGAPDTAQMSYDELCAYLTENPGAELGRERMR